MTSFAETEKQMVSVERCGQYMNDIPSERQDSLLCVSRALQTRKNLPGLHTVLLAQAAYVIKNKYLKKKLNFRTFSAFIVIQLRTV